MPKVAINVCFGGFGLSPKALLWLHNRGCADIATPIDQYFGDLKRRDEALAAWRRYLQVKPEETPFGLTVFTSDESHVLYGGHGLKRDDPLLIECIEALEDEADGQYAKLKIVEIPDGVAWTVEEYDGNEHVAEEHRTWP